MSFYMLKYTPTGQHTARWDNIELDNLSDLTDCNLIRCDGEECIYINGFTRPAGTHVGWHTIVNRQLLPVKNLASFSANHEAECINIYRPDLIGFMWYEKNHGRASCIRMTYVSDEDPGTYVFGSSPYAAAYFEDLPSLIHFIRNAPSEDRVFIDTMLVRNHGS